MTRMRRLLCAFWLGTAGCLFVGDINKRPEASLVAEQTATTIGQPLLLQGDIIDDQEGGEVQLSVHDDANNDVTMDPCVVAVTPYSGDFYAVTLWRAGTYTIIATPFDALHAKGAISTVQVSVKDAPPTFTSSTQQIADGSTPTACTTLHVATKPIRIRRDADVSDLETDPGAPRPPVDCPPPSPLVETWKITNGPAGNAAVLGFAADDGTCPDDPTNPTTTLESSAPVVCLYPDREAPTGMPSTYTVELDLDDGVNPPVSSAPLNVSVIGNAAACLDGVYPAAGDYVLPRDEVSLFQALGIDDATAAPSLEFTWSLEREGEASYTPLGPSTTAADGGGRFIFDPVALGLSVGDTVRLRVELADPEYTGAACAADDDVCTAASCAAMSCARRAAWALEIR